MSRLWGLLLAVLLCGVGAGNAADVHRLLQAEIQGQSVGSKSYSAEGYLTLPRADANTFKGVMVLEANATTPESLARYTQHKQDLSGVLLLLPPQQPPGAALSAEHAEGLLQLEQQLLSAPTVVPVFFAHATKELADAVAGTAAMFSRGTPPNQHSDRFQLRIQGSLPSKVPAKQAINYVASLKATDDQFKPGVPVAPTLLLTAHYDSFSPAPGAPGGADSSGSGAAATLLLLRLLHRLYASPESRPSRNVLVVLTTGGPYGQAGLQQWLADADPAQLEALEAAVVLDSVGASTIMQQSSKPGSSGSAARLHAHQSGGGSDAWAAAVAAAAARVGVTLVPETTKLASEQDPSNAAVFGHEHLARKGVPAVSLSSLCCRPEAALGGRVRASSLADVAAGVNLNAVLDAAQVTADAVTRWLFPDLDPQLRLLELAAEPQQHLDFLAAWVRLISDAQNMMPFDQAEASGTELHDSLRQFMRGNSHGSVKRHAWITAGSAAGVTAWSGSVAQLKVHSQAGYLLDMVLTAAVLAYLVGLYVALAIYSHGLEGFTASFSPKPAKRTRSKRS